MAAFVLSSPMCAPSFPFTFGRLAGLESGGLSGAAAAAKHVSDLTAADLPSLARAPLKALAHSLACALVQMGLDVATSAFAVGSTAKLVGNSVCHMLDSTGGLSLGSIAQDLGGDVLADNIADAVGGGAAGRSARPLFSSSIEHSTCPLPVATAAPSSTAPSPRWRASSLGKASEKMGE